LTESKNWVLPRGAGISKDGVIEPKISSFDFTGSLVDFIQFERERVLALPKALSIMEIEKKDREISKIDSYIITKHILVEENTTQINKEWKFLLISLGVVIPFVLLGINMK